MIIMFTSPPRRVIIFFLPSIPCCSHYPPYHEPPANKPVVVRATPAEEERKAEVAVRALATTAPKALPPMRKEKPVRVPMAAAAAGRRRGAGE